MAWALPVRKMPLKEFKADLHIHTCLSACADASMLPGQIIRRAKSKSLEIIGICDHNSAENVLAVQMAARESGILVLGGMEISSQEEVHLLGLFSDNHSLRRMQEIIYKNLPAEIKRDHSGEQLIADEHDKIIGVSSKLLIAAVNLSLEKIVVLIKSLGGLAIASHIDRKAFGLIGQIGFIPEGLELDALEVTADCPASQIDEYKKYGCGIIRSSDAHFLQDIGSAATVFSLSAPEFSEIDLALHGGQGRKAKI